jgi:hypothetical protein
MERTARRFSWWSRVDEGWSAAATPWRGGDATVVFFSFVWLQGKEQRGGGKRGVAAARGRRGDGARVSRRRLKGRGEGAGGDGGCGVTSFGGEDEHATSVRKTATGEIFSPPEGVWAKLDWTQEEEGEGVGRSAGCLFGPPGKREGREEDGLGKREPRKRGGVFYLNLFSLFV